MDALRDFISERERAWVAGEFETFDRPEDEPLPPDRVHSIELLQLAIGIPTDRQNKNHSQRLRTLMEQGLG
ncbi:hypothetical protein [Bradyrhizobium sp. S3.2.12]|uniref:hypothetical protein n=1 Tax=Bradyrhizobium sp. S3.2.12 TaxID=3156387 RepID=UPI0033983B77